MIQIVDMVSLRLGNIGRLSPLGFRSDDLAGEMFSSAVAPIETNVSWGADVLGAQNWWSSNPASWHSKQSHSH